MGAIVDLIVALVPPQLAALFVALAVVDYLQVRYLDQRLDRIGGRVSRLEDTFIATDGGDVDRDE